MANNKCKECGCICNKCVSSHDVHLHVEIENLKQRLLERDNHIVTMETTFLNEANKFPNGEFVALREELLTWQDKYSRLYDAHKRVQKVNQSLEDKLLKLVDKTETEKSALTKDVAILSHRLADANYTIQRLQNDNEKYKNDVNLAIQLLQCKPGNFVSHRLDSLPNEVQAKVSSYVASRRKPPEERKSTTSEVRSIKVPIPTFPPTAMVYSIPKSTSPEKESSNPSDPEGPPQIDIVSAAIMAKILEEREKERAFTKHCDSCTCSKTNFLTHHSIATQTAHASVKLCPKCNNDLVERSSPLGSMKIKSSDVPNKLILSDTKTYPQYTELNETSRINVSENSKVNVSTFSDAFIKTPPKVIDPKSGHHRLCEQNQQQQLNMAAVDTEEEDITNRKTNASQNKNDTVKGPRYCSLRLQSGSKNILLDNVPGNYAPVLYTRQESSEKKQKSKEREKEIISQPNHNNNNNSSRTGTVGSSSSDDRKSLNLSECDNSYHKQQRVAEWIQMIDENEASASDEHSRNDRIETHTKRLNDFTPQIESNVNKSFLYKTELIDHNDPKCVKRLTNFKQKYQSLPQIDASIIELKGIQKKHTETEI